VLLSLAVANCFLLGHIVVHSVAFHQICCRICVINEVTNVVLSAAVAIGLSLSFYNMKLPLNNDNLSTTALNLRFRGRSFACGLNFK